MLKIALAQIEIIPGRPDINTKTMLTMIKQARQQCAQMIIFPEMSIPGYFLGDTWEQLTFLKDCEEYGQRIIDASVDICIVFGNIAMDWNKVNDDGRVRKYNACFIAHQGKLLGNDNFPYPYRIKTLQPNYREFDDSRHFYSLRKLAIELGKNVNQLLQPVTLNIANKQFKLGCLLCEDGWCDDYAVKPVGAIHQNGPVDFFINISSSPYTIGKNNKRNRLFSTQVKNVNCPLIYVNNTGIQNNGKTVYTFDGCSTVYNRRGEIIEYCPAFSTNLTCVDLHLTTDNIETATTIPNDDSDIHTIYQGIAYGTKHFLDSIGMRKVVIGASGGIDSAVSAAIYTKILGPDNVLLVNMPSIYNSRTTKDLSAKLAQNLGCQYTIIPIQEVVDYTVEQLKKSPITNLSTGDKQQLTISPFIIENIQARDRSSRILAGVAAAFGAGFTCNANKSEMTVGYSTLYGDQAGFLAALSDLWKHQVYELAEYLNRHIYKKEVIPQEIIDLVPSAELSFEQSVDEGKGDPIIYSYHDYLFRAFMEHWNRRTPEDILLWYEQGTLEEKIGCQAGLVATLFPTPDEFITDLEKWWKLYTGMAVAKRIQAPPVLAVSRRAYGFDHREAQNRTYFTMNYELLKERLLQNRS
ncbi:NAD(+) synthase [Pelosinus sp. UFO1]|uniref:NAD(+) synthase n=1 Tax=Pelosinus sp. UFO1 TaxID=484770 RepID=UPI0004D0D5D9|nr:NAD(+) synthase [Pelosinus sp. UFO1]AIF52169.1 NAD+ synthetase [Pelosinus sp. UFO1]